MKKYFKLITYLLNVSNWKVATPQSNGAVLNRILGEVMYLPFYTGGKIQYRWRGIWIDHNFSEQEPLPEYEIATVLVIKNRKIYLIPNNDIQIVSGSVLETWSDDLADSMPKENMDKTKAMHKEKIHDKLVDEERGISVLSLTKQLSEYEYITNPVLFWFITSVLRVSLYFKTKLLDEIPSN